MSNHLNGFGDLAGCSGPLNFYGKGYGCNTANRARRMVIWSKDMGDLQFRFKTCSSHSFRNFQKILMLIQNSRSQEKDTTLIQLKDPLFSDQTVVDSILTTRVNEEVTTLLFEQKE